MTTLSTVELELLRAIRDGATSLALMIAELQYAAISGRLQVDGPSIATQHALGELRRRRLVRQEFTEERAFLRRPPSSPQNWLITPEGRAMLKIEAPGPRRLQ